MRAGNSRPKIGCEFALRSSASEFFPRPLFLHKLSILAKPCLLLKHLTVGKSVGDHHVKMVILHPLSELSVGKFFSIDATESGITMRGTGRLRHFYCKGVRGDTPAARLEKRDTRV